MKTVTIICDACGSDLTRTGNSVDYRLVVTSEGIPSGGGAVTDWGASPPVKRAYHFCGLKCLRDSELVSCTPLEQATG